MSAQPTLVPLSVRAQWAEHIARLESLYRGETPDRVVAIAGAGYGLSHGLWGTNHIDMLAEPDAWIDEMLADIRARADQAGDPVTFRPIVIELDPLGVHFIDALLGARVYFHEGQVWANPLAVDPGELAPPDLASLPLMQQALTLARKLVARTAGEVYLTTPVLSCAINVGMSVLDQPLLEAMALRPEAARHALGVINATIARTWALFAEVIPPAVRRGSVACNRWAPDGHSFIDGCATQLVSPRHYQEFLLDLDAALLALEPNGGMMHLCGAHEHLIPLWREMPGLRAVQLNDRAAEGFEAYFHGLREDQIVYLSPTETMTVDRILHTSSGRRVVLQCDLPAPIPLTDAS